MPYDCATFYLPKQADGYAGYPLALRSRTGPKARCEVNKPFFSVEQYIGAAVNSHFTNAEF